MCPSRRNWSRVYQPKALKTKLAQLGPSGSSLLRSDGSYDGQAGGWTSWVVAKTLKGELVNNSRSQGTQLENWRCESLKKVQLTLSQLIFLRVRWRREMKLLMMKMMMRWEPVYHKTEWQRHCVLRNCSSSLSICRSLRILERSTMREEGRIRTVNAIHSAGPARFPTSQPNLTASYKVSVQTGFFWTNILWLGKTVLLLLIQHCCKKVEL